MSELYLAFVDPQIRVKWLQDTDYEIRKATQNKSVRATWIDGKSSIEIGFYEKGPVKSQVVVQHSKLANRAVVELQRSYWTRQLARLKELLEAS